MEFQQKIISGKNFKNFVQTKAIIFQNLWNFALLSAILLLVHIALKNSKTIHTSTFICCMHPTKETRP